MSKAKQRKRERQQQGAKAKPGHRMSQKAGITKPQQKRQTINIKKASTTKSATAPQASQQGQSVPFSPAQKILLVGEGDFSFSVSLSQSHKCPHLVCTTFESRSTLLEKHPQTSSYISTLESRGAKVLYSIDATALCHPQRGGGSNLRRMGPFDRVVFNFPHVGGLTKDVNRQVRANQELCVKFLESAAQKQLLAPGGRVVVTLFEGEPYELWGIRNLARHVGLVVDRSAAFEWDAYPGYKHARTLGNVAGGGGWKGEDRRARMYVFGRPGEEDAVPGKNARKSRKRRRGVGGASDSELDSEDEAEVRQWEEREAESDGDIGEEDEADDDHVNDGTEAAGGTGLSKEVEDVDAADEEFEGFDDSLEES